MSQERQADRPEEGKFYEQASQNTTETENYFSHGEVDEVGALGRFGIVESSSASQRLFSGCR